MGSTPPKTRRKGRRRRVLTTLVVGVPVLAIGLWIAVHKIPWLGPMLANTLRAGVGTRQATRTINDQNALILDVRTADEFEDGHLPGARNIPANEIVKRGAELPAGKPVIVVCASGNRAGKAAAALRTGGRQDVFCLDGGIAQWQQAGLPLVKK